MSARAFGLLLLMAFLAVAIAEASAENSGRVLFPLVLAHRPEWCEPAYPTICVPSPPPDLDCPEIPFQNFVVIRPGPDPHGFDADSDGIGCEFP